MTEDLALIDVALVRDVRMALLYFLRSPDADEDTAFERLGDVEDALGTWLEAVQGKTMKKMKATVELPGDMVQPAFDACLENGIVAALPCKGCVSGR